MDCSGLKWAGAGLHGMAWIKMRWNMMERVKMDCNGSRWVGIGCLALGWHAVEALELVDVGSNGLKLVGINGIDYVEKR